MDAENIIRICYALRLVAMGVVLGWALTMHIVFRAARRKGE